MNNKPIGIIVAAGLIETLITFSGEGGLRQYCLDNPEICLRIEVDDPKAICDIDRPEDIC